MRTAYRPTPHRASLGDALFKNLPLDTPAVPAGVSSNKTRDLVVLRVDGLRRFHDQRRDRGGSRQSAISTKIRAGGQRDERTQSLGDRLQTPSQSPRVNRVQASANIFSSSVQAIPVDLRISRNPGLNQDDSDETKSASTQPTADAASARAAMPAHLHDQRITPRSRSTGAAAPGASSATALSCISVLAAVPPRTARGASTSAGFVRSLRRDALRISMRGLERCGTAHRWSRARQCWPRRGHNRRRQVPEIVEFTSSMV